MRVGEVFAAVAGFCARRALVVIVLAALVAAGCVVAATQLEPRTGTDTLVSGSSPTAKETAAFKRDFGDDAIVVLVEGRGEAGLQKTLESGDLGRLIRFEGCLSGNVPARGLRRLPEVCRELSRSKPARVVFGPATFINTSVNRISDEFGKRSRAAGKQADTAAKAAERLSQQRGDPPERQRQLAANARQLVQAQFTQQVLELGLRYGLTSAPALNNPEFIDTLVFGAPERGRVGVPKARFAYLFPNRRSALVQIRLRPDLDDAQRRHAIDLIRRASQERAFEPRNGARLVVTGVPVVSDGLATEVQRGLIGLLVAALVVMAAVLALVFRTRRRLLPLLLALGAAAVTFAALALTGGGLTMASIAVMPVLIGLAVDYAIQFQARFDESLRRDRAGPVAAARGAARAGGPTIASAAAATAVGFLVLLASPIPLVRGFGVLVVVGIVAALVITLTVGFAVLGGLGERATQRSAPGRMRASMARVGALAPLVGVRRRWRAAVLWAIERGELTVARAVARPRRVLAIGLVLALVGWALDTQAGVVSDVRKLVPQDLQELRDVNTLQAETGVAGEIDVTVRAEDITRPDVVAWMGRFQDATLRSAGYRDGDRCAQTRDPPDLCPALSLPTLLRTVDTGSQRQVRGLLDAVPPYFSQGVVTRDRKTANLAFGVRLSSLDDQQRIIDAMDDRIARSQPPRGVDADVVGFPVLAAQANSALSSPLRRALALLAALGAVFLVLLAVHRRPRDAFVPLIPIALATGWSAGVLFVLGLLPEPLRVQLNPMSVTLGALVIAITTEFSVLLSARYREERRAGAAPARAIERAYSSTGAAVVASGITATAGFAVLIASDITMLRDFGILTVVDLSVSLLGVLVVLPAALLWGESRADAARDTARRPRRPRLPRPSIGALRALRRDG